MEMLKNKSKIGSFYVADADAIVDEQRSNTARCDQFEENTYKQNSMSSNLIILLHMPGCEMCVSDGSYLKRAIFFTVFLDLGRFRSDKRFFGSKLWSFEFIEPFWVILSFDCDDYYYYFKIGDFLKLKWNPCPKKLNLQSRHHIANSMAIEDRTYLADRSRSPVFAFLFSTNGKRLETTIKLLFGIGSACVTVICVSTIFTKLYKHFGLINDFTLNFMQ